MDKFNDGGQVDMLVAAVTEMPGNQQQQGRAQAFAAAVDDIMAELVDEGDIGMQGLLDQPVDLLHVFGNELLDGLDVHGRAGGKGGFGNFH